MSETDLCQLEFLADVLEMLIDSVHFVFILQQLILVSQQQLLIRLNLVADTVNYQSNCSHHSEL